MKRFQNWWWISLIAATTCVYLLLSSKLSSRKECSEMTETHQYYSKDCEKRKDIAFLKAHKCGSTTVANILQRFGLRENLNFVLPDKAEDQFWVLGKLSSNTFKEIIALPIGEVYNILSVDTVFDKDIYQELIPNNPFILAIMRDPVERFVSSVYFSLKRYKPMMKSGPYPFKETAMNPSYHDFVFDTSKGIKQALKKTENDFDFVMITEYFDESLVLLKYKLCWSTKDIIYTTKNINLKTIDRISIEKRVGVYKNVYDHFKMKLFQEMSSHGKDFLKEVDNFKTILKQVHDYCTFPTKTPLQISSSSWNENFSVDQSECRLMNLKEFPMVKMLQERQSKMLE